MNKKFYFLIFLFCFLFPPAASAYAGPGVAIGAIIVFFTVILAFFASTFITIFNFIKGNISKIFNKKSVKKKVKNQKNNKLN